MRPRLAVLSTATAVGLLTAACQSGGGEDEMSDTSLVGGATGAGCVIEVPVPVGAALSLTGEAGSYGLSQQLGLELAAEHLADRGGVRYDLRIQDDRSDPGEATTLVEGFVQEGVSVIIGPTLSTSAFQAQPAAQESGVPVLAISNTAKGITEQGDHIFRSSLTEAQVIPQTMARAQEEYGLEDVVVLYGTDDAFTESGYESFVDALRAEGIEISATVTFSRTDTDFGPLLTEALAADPDALVVSALIEAAIPLVVQARELGMDGPIIGGNGFNNPRLMAEGGQAAEGVVVGAAWNAAVDNPLSADFISAFRERYDAEPDQFAAQAYAGLMIVDQAVRSSCSAERGAIRAGLDGIADVDTVLGTVTINEARDIEHPAVVQVVRDGRFTLLD